MEEKIGEIKEKITKISKMNLKEYIEYKNGHKREIEENDDIADEEETMHDEIEKK